MSRALVMHQIHPYRGLSSASVMTRDLPNIFSTVSSLFQFFDTPTVFDVNDFETRLVSLVIDVMAEV